ncbi:hypothetical protein SYNPS1DRAFT_31221 [Syncephalis pseudoplumigaleata]|uniref:Uncharacterized protein n=1 Tax=Syncephalis pseudoplumigaleata TaxID=1712513 RepID=A0A4P9YUK9_9FUNG|nr:hypothetical protein SYNPS1DRAFT_31221 [Syncephalis pseudoplumigaleata]|eukprot:RKP23082.1 hypothetical protein SYNPS1DRAFT_31221 [Syncephalis pseudoplumigaleata]
MNKAPAVRQTHDTYATDAHQPSDAVDVRSKPGDSALDTLPEMVRKMTFEPSLAVPPLPEGVIDELRNRYSRYQSIKESKRRTQWFAEDAALSAKGKDASTSSTAAAAPSTTSA